MAEKDDAGGLSSRLKETFDGLPPSPAVLAVNKLLQHLEERPPAPDAATYGQPWGVAAGREDVGELDDDNDDGHDGGGGGDDAGGNGEDDTKRATTTRT